MKIMKKLKALFLKNDRPVSLDLCRAEIKEGRAYLHPKETPSTTYLVKSDDIEIRLNKGRGLDEKDIIVLGKRKQETKDPTTPKRKCNQHKTDKKLPPKSSNSSDSGNEIYDLSRFKKKTFSVSLYPEEYDRLMETIQKSGYKRSEFVLASSVSVTEKRMASAQKKVVSARKELRKEEKALKAKQNQTT